MASSVEFKVKKHGKVSADPDSLTVIAGASITFTNKNEEFDVQVTFPAGVLSGGTTQFTVNADTSSTQSVLSAYTGTATYSMKIVDGSGEGTGEGDIIVSKE